MLERQSSPILLVISVDKAEKISPLSKLLQLKKQVRIELPERLDRKLILEDLVPKRLLDSIDMLEIAKYLQGKTYRDIKQIVQKMRRAFPLAFKSDAVSQISS